MKTNIKTTQRQVRVHEEIDYTPRPNGGTTTVVICPFCTTKVTARVWSLGGSGKKCPACNAVHGGQGTSWREIPMDNAGIAWQIHDEVGVSDEEPLSFSVVGIIEEVLDIHFPERKIE